MGHGIPVQCEAPQSPSHTEHVWAADLSEGAQGLQAPGHGTGEALLSAQRREDQAVLRAVGLIGPVRAPELLDGLVRAPGQLMRQVHPLPLVDEAPAGMPGRLTHTSLFQAHKKDAECYQASSCMKVLCRLGEQAKMT